MKREYTPSELPTYEDLLARDSGSVPDSFFVNNPAETSTKGLSINRYTEKSFHDLEVDRMWKRVWQFACFEDDVPRVGSYTLYEIAGISIIITRSDENQFSAFYNACLHRGAALATQSGTKKRFVCPYHGWTYDLQGNLLDIPAQWDFPHVCPGNQNIKPVRVESFMGVLFVNMDDGAPPLDDYLSTVKENIRTFPSYISGHRQRTAWVRKVVPINWKHAQEAFMEGYHLQTTHPELAPGSPGYEMRYNVLGDHGMGLVSAQLGPTTRTGPDITEQELMNRFTSMQGMPELKVEPGQTARSVLAAISRQNLNQSLGLDLSSMSDAEVIDSPLTFVFPNTVFWGGYLVPWIYRFRPNGNDPHSAIMEVFQMTIVPEGTESQHVPMRILDDEEPFAAADELGYLGPVLDQDFNNMKLQSIGLASTPETELRYSRYQESLIRRHHDVIDRYLQRD